MKNMIKSIHTTYEWERSVQEVFYHVKPDLYLRFSLPYFNLPFILPEVSPGVTIIDSHLPKD